MIVRRNHTGLACHSAVLSVQLEAMFAWRGLCLVHLLVLLLILFQGLRISIQTFKHELLVLNYIQNANNKKIHNYQKVQQGAARAGLGLSRVLFLPS